MHQAVLEAARDCDLIHIQTPFVAHYAGLKAARTLGLPVIATYHTLFEEYLQHYARFCPSGWLRGQARRFSRRQCNELDAVVVPSTAMRQRLESYGVTTPMNVLPTGIPIGAVCRRGWPGLPPAAWHCRESTRGLVRWPGGARKEYRLPARSPARGMPTLPGCFAGDRRRRPGNGRAQGPGESARFAAGRPVHWLSRSPAGPARLLCGGRCLRIRLAHRNAGAGLA